MFLYHAVRTLREAQDETGRSLVQDAAARAHLPLLALLPVRPVRRARHRPSCPPMTPEERAAFEKRRRGRNWAIWLALLGSGGAVLLHRHGAQSC
jgi:hypothetical protein